MEFHLDKDGGGLDIGGKPSILGLMSWAIYRDLVDSEYSAFKRGVALEKTIRWIQLNPNLVEDT